ncbi:MAG: hypothetical protein KBD27_01955 [Candidatus Moranbacteria bacterium]|nr:hypothetical protein [Candidatus Moranbacteria bacterium]
MTPQLHSFLGLFGAVVDATIAEERTDIADCFREMTKIKQELQSEGLVPNVREYRVFVGCMIAASDSVIRRRQARLVFHDYCYFQQAVAILGRLPGLQRSLSEAGFVEWATLRPDRWTFRWFAQEVAGELTALLESESLPQDQVALVADQLELVSDVYHLPLEPLYQGIIDLRHALQPPWGDRHSPVQKN